LKRSASILHEKQATGLNVFCQCRERPQRQGKRQGEAKNRQQCFPPGIHSLPYLALYRNAPVVAIRKPRAMSGVCWLTRSAVSAGCKRRSCMLRASVRMAAAKEFCVAWITVPNEEEATSLAGR
jgi:hypothetical protein